MLKDNERLDDLMCNNFHIIQDPTEYCFTSDATKLGNFVKSKKTDKVVDLCSGSGIVGIVVYLNNGSNITFVELQEHLADMCNRTIQLNNFKNMKVVNSPLQNIYKTIGNGEYDVVVCNPPYFKMEEKACPSSIDSTHQAKKRAQIYLCPSKGDFLCNIQLQRTAYIR